MIYKSYRIVDGRPRWVIIDENENIVNRNPNKDKLKLLSEIPREMYKIKRKGEGQTYTKEYGLKMKKVGFL